MTKPHVRLEFLIDSYQKVPCRICPNSKVDEDSRCYSCTLTKRERIERTERFFSVENSEWNKTAILKRAGQIGGAESAKQKASNNKRT